MPVDPVEQAERYLQDYALAFGDQCAWAASKPRHSLCFSLVRALFEAGFVLEDLEWVLQGMFAEKLRPKSYPWLLAVTKARLEDLRHERRTQAAEPTTGA